MKKKIIIRIVLICLLSIILVILCGYIILKNVIYPLNHFSIVKEEASKNNIDPYLVMAIIKTESGFKKDATSNKDAKGLMQIIDSTATDINNKTNIVNDNRNIIGLPYFHHGCKTIHLRHHDIDHNQVYNIAHQHIQGLESIISLQCPISFQFKYFGNDTYNFSVIIYN